MKKYIFLILLTSNTGIFSNVNYTNNLSDHTTSKSQNGQDLYILNNFFPDKTDGFFIEIGAFDGIKFSNSYLFEQRGWKGICVEPIAQSFTQLIKNRNCICIQSCISDQDGLAEFVQVGGSGIMLSGLLQKYDPLHVERITKSREKCTNYYVPCCSLSTLIAYFNLDTIHFLSIDTEGGELDMLKSLRKDELASIQVICIEDNYHDPKIITFFEDNNFSLATRMEQDLIFFNKNLFLFNLERTL